MYMCTKIYITTCVYIFEYICVDIHEIFKITIL